MHEGSVVVLQILFAIVLIEEERHIIRNVLYHVILINYVIGCLEYKIIIHELV